MSKEWVNRGPWRKIIEGAAGNSGPINLADQFDPNCFLDPLGKNLIVGIRDWVARAAVIGGLLTGGAFASGCEGEKSSASGPVRPQDSFPTATVSSSPRETPIYLSPTPAVEFDTLPFSPVLIGINFEGSPGFANVEMTSISIPKELLESQGFQPLIPKWSNGQEVLLFEVQGKEVAVGNFNAPSYDLWDVKARVFNNKEGKYHIPIRKFKDGEIEIVCFDKEKGELISVFLRDGKVVRVEPYWQDLNGRASLEEENDGLYLVLRGSNKELIQKELLIPFLGQETPTPTVVPTETPTLVPTPTETKIPTSAEIKPSWVVNVSNAEARYNPEKKVWEYYSTAEEEKGRYIVSVRQNEQGEYFFHNYGEELNVVLHPELLADATFDEIAKTMKETGAVKYIPCFREGIEKLKVQFFPKFDNQPLGLIIYPRVYPLDVYYPYLKEGQADPGYPLMVIILSDINQGKPGWETRWVQVYALDNSEKPRIMSPVESKVGSGIWAKTGTLIMRVQTGLVKIAGRQEKEYDDPDNRMLLDSFARDKRGRLMVPASGGL